MSALSTEKKTAVVLVSGGMDSCVVAALAADRGYNLAMLHINYGQRTEARELVSFNQLATHYDAADRLVANIRYLSAIGGSSLTDSSLRVAAADKPAIESSKIPLTYVPFRNTHLLAIAASWGETLQAERIMIGIVEEDASGYPDCRKSYIAAMNEVVRLGTRPETKLEIDAPLVDMSKAAIVRLGADLSAPFGLTWSCYRRDDVPCRNCLSCELRARAFAEAQIQDPLLAGA